MAEKNKKHSLDKIRKEVNQIDAELLSLFSKRREASIKVAKSKEQSKRAIRDTEREEEALVNLIKQGRDFGLDAHFVTQVFNELIRDSVRLQHQFFQEKLNQQDSDKPIIRVAYQGIEGAFSHLASQKFFSKYEEKTVFIGTNSFKEALECVERGEADYAVIPIENTTSGGINQVYDLLLHTRLSIAGEEKFKVDHCLLALDDDIAIESLTHIYSHPVAIAQCTHFLNTLPKVKIEYQRDTAYSVLQVREEGKVYKAAIASEEAAKMFGLKVLKRNIANQDGNFTRFLVITGKPLKVDSRVPCKTSIVMATSQNPGSLADALQVFKSRNLNLTKLESRPILGRPWEEMFYLDFEGNADDTNVQECLDDLYKITRYLKVIGCYPAQEITSTKVSMPLALNDDEKEETRLEDEQAKSKAKPKGYLLASRSHKEEDSIIKVGDLEIGGDNFVVIGGPCSVESQEQIHTCANRVKESGGHILRGGCFKPRTSPYSFQGLGYEGLDLLKDAGQNYDLPIITEVLTMEDVVRVAEKSDILQVGARNMQNFPLLKEVGRSLRPVMLKRGLMASLDELLQAAEYILSQGNQQVMLCERGIRTFETATRNTLDISAVPILKELTHLPIFVDPSHAAGKRYLVQPLAYAAKAVGAHGIMVEIHPKPEEALSDGPQALRLNQFTQMMENLRAV